jgi:hypothetical protein
MKLQTGVRVDAELWRAYKLLCRRDKLRPAQPIEDFLRLVVENDSALSLLRMMRGAAKTRVDGVEAYVRVLLDWYAHDKYWVKISDEDTSVESLLLDSLKVVANPDLRGQIEEALKAHQRGIYEKKAGKA